MACITADLPRSYLRAPVKTTNKASIFNFKTKKRHFEGYYEPYYGKGENVFLESTIRSGFGNPPIMPPNTSAEKTSEYGTSEKPKNEMSIYRECYIDCPNYLLQFYQSICAWRFNTKTWKNEYLSFDNLCDMEYFNCQHASARPVWKLLHRGHCPEYNTFGYYPTDVDEIMDRAAKLNDEEYKTVTKSKSKNKST